MQRKIIFYRSGTFACSLATAFFAASSMLLSPSCCPADIPVIRGTDFNPLIVNSERLYGRKIIVEDLMADHKRTFTSSEKKRGFKDYYYVKFVLRDSKLPCFVCKYDYKDMDAFMEIKKGDRVTIVGQIERIGRGVKRFVNPKFVLRVDEISKGWEPSGEESVIESVRDEEPINYLDIPPGELENVPQDHAGKFIRIRERFSLTSTYFTNFEKDLNLSNETALKFRGEKLRWPYYLPLDEENRRTLSELKSGDKITIYGRVNVRDIPDDRMVLLSTHAIKKGWE